MITRDCVASWWVRVLCLALLGAAGRLLAVQGQFAAPSAEVRGLIEAGRYEDAEAAAERLVAEATAVSGPESLEVARAIDLLVEGLWRNGKAQQARTRELGERAIRIKEPRLKPEEMELSLSLRNLAYTLLAAGEARLSLPLFERALANHERTDGPQTVATAEALDDLAGAEIESGQENAARRLLDRALTIKEASLGPNGRELARTLDQFARLKHKGGRLSGRSSFARAVSANSRIRQTSRSRPREHAVSARQSVLVRG